MKEIIITICLLFSFSLLYAVKPVTKDENKTGRNAAYTPSTMQASYNRIIYQEQGFFIDGSPGLSTILSKNQSSEIWKSEGGLGYNVSLGYFRTISPLLKLKLGIGFSSFDAKLTGDGEIQSNELTDIDNDIYFESLTISNVEYNINPMYVTVPLVVEFGNPNISKLGYYFDLGFEYAYMINENSSISGTYSTRGIYPQWGVTIENVPELGFYTARELDSTGDLPKSNYSVKGGAGITVPLSGIVIFKIGVMGYLGLNDIGSKRATKPDSSPLSQQTYEFRSKYINSPLTSSSGSKTLYTGIEFGFYISNRVK